jgi:hypothetical protein
VLADLLDAPKAMPVVRHDVPTGLKIRDPHAPAAYTSPWRRRRRQRSRRPALEHSDHAGTQT